MKVLVVAKRVVDHNVKVRIAKDGLSLDTDGVKHSINPFDEHALEEGVRLKERGLASEIVVVGVGGASVQDVLRHSLALGADRATLVLSSTEPSNLNLAKILVAIYKKEQPDLVLIGKQSIDDDASEVAQMLAAKLDLPQVVAASNLSSNAQGELQVTVEVDGGQQDWSVSLPAVISADLRLNEPRYIKLPNLMQAKKKPLETIELETLGVDFENKLNLVRYEEPPVRTAGTKLNSIDELVAVLKQRLEA